MNPRNQLPDDDLEQLTRTTAPEASVGVEGATATMDPARAAAEGRRAPLPRGTVLGRYVLLKPMGAGGMGVVYEAYDPELDRRIALKLLAVDLSKASSRKRAQDRLLREAQALAQLSHPNVIAVHDVGTIAGDVFIALELVAGGTLGEWLTATPRTEAEILAAFLAAGDGLAAAHRQGIIHRDFKPGNVIVGDDGRVRVIDFGLARAVDEADESHDEGDEHDEPLEALAADGEHTPREDWLHTPLTRVGAVMGTPKYMSPEQHLGRSADARSDQFSFCVALYEAISKVAPFTGSTRSELSARVTRGEIATPATGRMRSWLRKVLVRGMAPDPADRFVDMDALLAELRRDRTLWRRRLAAAALMSAIGGVAVVGWMRTAGSDELCKGGRQRVAQVWTAEQREAVRAAFAVTGSKRTSDVMTRLDGIMNQFIADWSDGYTQACVATRVRGEQSESLMDRRMGCLERRRDQMTALVGVFLSAESAEHVDKAVEASTRLASVERCADVDVLLAATPPPEDPVVRARSEELYRDVDRAEALELAGRYSEGVEVAAAARQQAETLDYAPLDAAALVRESSLLEKAGKYPESSEAARKAALAAGTAKDYLLLARAWGLLIWNLGYRQAQTVEALALLHPAQVAVQLAGSDPETEGFIHERIGAVYLQTSEYARAEENFVKAVSLLESAFGKTDVKLATSVNNLGLALMRQNRFREATAQFERALKLWEQALGVGHPSTAPPINNLGRVAAELGDHARASDYFMRAAAIDSVTLGEEHPMYAAALANFGLTELQLGRLDSALEQLTRSQDIMQRALGDDHIYTAMTMSNLGIAYALRNDDVKAVDVYGASLEIFDRSKSRASEPALELLVNMALAETRLRRWDAARAHLEEARDGVATALGETHVNYALVLAALAEVDLGVNQPARALKTAARAMELAEQQPDATPLQLATIKLSLARASWARGERQRATALADSAGAAIATDRSLDGKRLRERIDSWRLLTVASSRRASAAAR